MSGIASLSLSEASAVFSAQRLNIERRLQSRVARIFNHQARNFNAAAFVRRAGNDLGVELREAQPLPGDELTAILLEMFPDMSRPMASAIVAEGTVAARISGNITLASIGYAQSFTIGPAVRDRLATGSLVAARSIDITSRSIIRATLTRGFTNEWTVQRMAREIQQDMDGWSRSRALMVARTETAEAWSSTQYEVLARNGWQAREWQTAQDDRVDFGDSGPCWDNEQAGPVPINEPFPSGSMWPPAHPRCRCNLSPAIGYGPASTMEPWNGEGGGDFAMPERQI